MNPVMSNLKNSLQQSRRSDSYNYGQAVGSNFNNTRVVTIESVVNKAILMVGAVIVTAILTWYLIGDTVNLQYAETILTVSALGGLALVLINSFKRKISPPLMMTYALVEGVFIGSASKVISLYVDDPSIVFNAVLGTFAVAVSVFLVFKYFHVRVSQKGQRILMIALGAFMLISLADFFLSFMGASFGFNGFGSLGMFSAIIAIGLGIFALLSDFTLVEQSIQMRLPEEYSWRLAFGLTVTIVWLYIEILRLLAMTQRR